MRGNEDTHNRQGNEDTHNRGAGNEDTHNKLTDNCNIRAEMGGAMRTPTIN